MTLTGLLATGFQKIINRGGARIRVQYFTSTIGSVWDDEVTWAQSGGDLWTSGVVLPISHQQGTSESVLLEQGKLIDDDKRLFIHGSLVLTGSEMTIRVGVGSPVNESYTLLNSDIRVDVYNTPIYRKVFLRRIGGTGSLLGM